jgi:hypothetical protein
MLDIPPELLIMISTHMNDHDLRALAVTSQSICRSLLPAYLCRRGLVLKDTGAEPRDLSGHASLGLWSISRIFHPPEMMHCSIPCGAQEAQSVMEFLIRFLLKPSNTRNLRDFHLFLRGSNPFLLTSKFIKMRSLLYTLSLTRLCFSGYGSVDCLPPSIAVRRGSSHGSHTLTSLAISSDYAFAPGLVQTTMGILRHSPIRGLEIYMVSLNQTQWLTLLGGLNMVFLEDIELEGNIPRPALTRFLIKHKGLKNIRIRGNMRSGRVQPSRLQSQPVLPNLLTLHAPLAVCCDIADQVANSSSLYELQIEVSQFHPHRDPSFRHLVEILRHFQKFNHLGLRLVPSSPLTMPQTSLNDHSWDEHPTRMLRQVRTLSFFQTQGQLSPGDIVCPHPFPSYFLPHPIDRTRCVLMYDHFQCWKRSRR